MSGDRATAPLVGGVALLERALGYTLGSLQLVTPELMHRPTPCRGWDLHRLLLHMNDSLAALHQAADPGQVEVGDQDSTNPDDPVAALRNRGCRMLGAWTGAGHEAVTVGDRKLSTSVVGATGAVEVAIHGWDVARACGGNRPVPASLAEELLPLAELLVTAADRPARFAEPVAAPPAASPGDRLLAFLGRDPG